MRHWTSLLLFVGLLPAGAWAEEPLTSLAQRMTQQPTVREVERQPLGVGPYSVSLGPEAAASPSSTASWFSVLGALALVIALIFVARVVLARFAQRGGSTSGVAVQVIGRTAVGPRCSVMLIRVGSRVLVVSDSSGGMRTLSEITDEQEVASLLALASGGSRLSATAGFASMLRTFHGKQAQDEQDGRDVNGALDQTREQVSQLVGRLRQLGRWRATA